MNKPTTATVYLLLGGFIAWAATELERILGL